MIKKALRAFAGDGGIETNLVFARNENFLKRALEVALEIEHEVKTTAFTQPTKMSPHRPEATPHAPGFTRELMQLIDMRVAVEQTGVAIFCQPVNLGLGKRLAQGMKRRQGEHNVAERAQS